MTKPSTLAHMRLAVALIAAGAAAAGSSIVACGKEDLTPAATQARTPRLADPNLKPLAGKDAGTDSGPRPDPCPGCGMG